MIWGLHIPLCCWLILIYFFCARCHLRHWVSVTNDISWLWYYGALLDWYGDENGDSIVAFWVALLLILLVFHVWYRFGLNWFLTLHFIILICISMIHWYMHGYGTNDDMWESVASEVFAGEGKREMSVCCPRFLAGNDGVSDARGLCRDRESVLVIRGYIPERVVHGLRGSPMGHDRRDVELSSVRDMLYKTAYALHSSYIHYCIALYLGSCWLLWYYCDVLIRIDYTKTWHNWV